MVDLLLAPVESTAFGRQRPEVQMLSPRPYLIVVGSTGHTLAYPVFLALEIMVIRCQLAQLLFG